MSQTATVRVMSAEEIIAQGGGEQPRLRWPEPTTIFAERAMRLAQRAGAGLAMADYLRLIGVIATEQQALLSSFPEVTVPDAASLDVAAMNGLPVIPAETWTRDPAWQAGLETLATRLRPQVPVAVQQTLDRILAMPAAEREWQASRLLTGVMQGLDLAAAPILAAALQVYWTRMLLLLKAAHAGKAQPIGPSAEATLCPCCGSRPTTSITRSVGINQGQRYLHCALCALEWHQVRIRCTHCLSEKSVAYQALDAADPNDPIDPIDPATAEGPSGHQAADGQATPVREIDSPASSSRAAKAAIQAETCDSCGHYLKLMHSDRDPFVDPLADDLATLALDLLVSDAGYRRYGVNLMLLIGDSDEEEAGARDQAPPGRPPDPGGH